KDVVGLFRKGQEAELRVVEKAVDEMELYQHLLAEKFGAIEKYLVVLKVIDVLHLERRHPYFPDDTTRRRAELDVLRRDQSLGQVRRIVLLSQYLVCKVEIIRS